MKKQFRKIVALTLIAALGLFGALPVGAFAVRKGRMDGQTLGSLLQREQTDSGREYQEHAALVMLKPGGTLTSAAATTALSSGKDGVSGISVESLWAFSDASAERTAYTQSAIATGARSGSDLSVSSVGGALNVALVRSETLSTKELIAQLRARDDVLYAEPNYRVRACSVNDPYFGSQWSMQSSDTAPNVSYVWNQGTTGSERIVAVVDTGVDYTHPDLKNRMWKNTHYPALKGECGYDFVGGDEDPMDENGHGTHCAGIIGAQGNNGVGISGVNQNIRIMALRTLDENGNSFLSHEIAAYCYVSRAIDLGEPVQAVNNSWAGGEYSQIFAELIDLVGRKGAVTVTSASNDSDNNDEVFVYPACIDSPYLITVAATREDGKLVGFSNYGASSVDMAAPGTDILSTVSYNCYNPSIYSPGKQSRVSAQLNDYEGGAAWAGLGAMQANLYLNGEPYDPDTYDGKQHISLSVSDADGFDVRGQGGSALRLEAKNLKKSDLICIPIPYEISKETESAPWLSVMVKSEGTSKGDVEHVGIACVLELPKDAPLDIDAIWDVETIDGVWIFRDDLDNWTHLKCQTLPDDKLSEAIDEGELQREIVLVFYMYSAGDITVCLDDFGFSRENLDPDVFEKYDFMSGTSQAAPYVSGAVALYAAYTDYPLRSDAEALVSEIVSMADTDPEDPLPIIMNGPFDFSKKMAEAGPRIGDIQVDSAAGTITIHGTGLDPAAGLQVEIGLSGGDMSTVTPLSRSTTEIVLRDEGWINNVVDLCLTGAGGIRSVRNSHYLIDGKGEYTPQAYLEKVCPIDALATDGQSIFIANSDCEGSAVILRLDTDEMETEILATVDPFELFTPPENPHLQIPYFWYFGSDLVYMNGKLYTVLEIGEGEEAETDFVPGGRQYPLYSSEFHLLSVDAVTGETEYLGPLPEELNRTEGGAMAAYNGKLWFLGGYDHGTDGLTARVMVFDPGGSGAARWSAGPAMPDVRVGGRALQVDGKLIYTLGYTDKDAYTNYYATAEDPAAPTNLIFDGGGWSVSAVPEGDLLPLTYYGLLEGTVGLAPGGLVYMGLPVQDYGDTFFYSLADDRFSDLGYNYIREVNVDGIPGREMDANGVLGITVGDTIYGFDGGAVFTAPLTAGGVSLAKELPFTDVAPDDPIYAAVVWAYNSLPRITNGQDAAHFAPDAAVRRGEAAALLWRAMGEPAPGSRETPFEDLTAEYYMDAVAWALAQGVTQGTDDARFGPDDTLTTAHIVTFLYRVLNPGRDGWYEEAAAWAAAQGYLEGIDLPIDDRTPCPRGLAVLILYNALA